MRDPILFDTVVTWVLVLLAAVFLVGFLVVIIALALSDILGPLVILCGCLGLGGLVWGIYRVALFIKERS